MRPRRLFLAALTALGACGAARADSIWDRRDERSAYLFTDERPRRVGDLVTIVVQEITNIDDNARRNANKNTRTGATLTYSAATNAGETSRSASGNATSDITSRRQLDSRSEYRDDQRFRDRMTAVVIDVLPNGNLVIEGRRRRIVQGEERILRISGIIRPTDVGPDNSILSGSIANFQVIYEGEGQESGFVRSGWLGRIMNRVWPF
jgi:flagellar L-ring protein precursor FlgH